MNDQRVTAREKEKNLVAVRNSARKDATTSRNVE